MHTPSSVPLAEFLACPVCHDPLDQPCADAGQGDAAHLICRACGDAFPADGPYPCLLPERVRSMPQWRMWNDHLAGFEARRRWRQEHKDHFASRLTNQSSPLQQAFSAFAQITVGPVLDVGCGPGNFRHALSETVQYIGIDPLPLDESTTFPFVQGVAEYLPFRDDTFAHVITMSALDHFQDVPQFFREVHRILKPGGQFHMVQSVHEIRGPVTVVKVAAHWLKDFAESKATRVVNESAPKHMTEFDTRSVAEILSDSFTLVRRSKYSKRWYSPENLFVTAEPTKRGQASFPSQRNNEA